jgi:hypothetical protein
MTRAIASSLAASPKGSSSAGAGASADGTGRVDGVCSPVAPGAGVSARVHDTADIKAAMITAADRYRGRVRRREEWDERVMSRPVRAPTTIE